MTDSTFIFHFILQSVYIPNYLQNSTVLIDSVFILMFIFNGILLLYIPKAIHTVLSIFNYSWFIASEKLPSVDFDSCCF